MLVEQFVCGRSKAILSVFLLVSSTYSLSMEEYPPQDDFSRSVSVAVEMGEDDCSGLPFFDEDWQSKVKADDTLYCQSMLAQSVPSENIPVKKEIGDGCKKHDNDDLDEWLVESCIKNMPPLLNCIYQYLGSNAPDNSERRIVTFHRFLLVGPPGASKSSTAEAIAQRLGFKKKIIPATSLRGKYRGRLKELTVDGNKIKKLGERSIFDPSHIFSPDHVEKGILKLGETKEVIVKKFVDIIKKADADGIIKEGLTRLHTKINGYEVEMRIFVKNGELLGFNGFVGHSGRLNPLPIKFLCE